MSKFPKAMAAIQKRDYSLWDIGDALIAECGKPSGGPKGPQDGSHGRLMEFAEELEEFGIDGYHLSYLRKLRDTAHNFPKKLRVEHLYWSIHFIAGSPEMLEAIEKAHGRKPVTTRSAHATKLTIQDRQKQVFEEENPDKKPPKYNDLPLPSQKEIRGLEFIAEVTHWINDLKSCEITIESVSEKVEKHLTKLETTDIDCLVDTALTLAEQARELADIARRLQSNKRSHLSLVGAAE